LGVDGTSLTLERLRQFERDRPQVELSAAARARMQQSAATVAATVASGHTAYGINTGFGAFANRVIPAQKTQKLQLNLVRSHACGVGEPLPPALVRRMLLLKANNLAAGFSGVRPLVVDTLLALLNADVLPEIPAQGSVGASGDLAPLAHLTLALIGEGEATAPQDAAANAAAGARRPLANVDVLRAAGVEPLELQAKEGLALLNGTQLSLALALDGLFRAETLLDASVVCCAMTVEGLAGSHSPFDDRIQQASRLPGQIEAARRIRALLASESEIRRSHEHCERVQDPYAVRCMPQVFGAVEHTLRHARDVLGAAINGVSDNPLIFPGENGAPDDSLSGGNFHAEPVAFAADMIAMAICEIGSLSERRIAMLVDPALSGLPAFLTPKPGLNSGFMIPQVTAAALVSENKQRAFPASVDSIPTSANQEDHVSMAAHGARRLAPMAANAMAVIAIEWLCATQGCDFHAPLTTSAPLQQVAALLRATVPHLSDDRHMQPDMNAAIAMVQSGALVAAVKGIQLPAIA